MASLQPLSFMLLVGCEIFILLLALCSLNEVRAIGTN